MYKFTKKLSIIGLFYEFFIIIIYLTGMGSWSSEGVLYQFLVINLNLVAWITFPFAYISSLFLKGDLSGINFIFFPFAGAIAGAVLGFCIDLILILVAKFNKGNKGVGSNE